MLSAFHNASGYAARFANQVQALSGMIASDGYTLRCVWGEGDSTDGTLAALRDLADRCNASVVDVTHGKTVHGSVVSAERFETMAGVWAIMFDQIGTDDIVVVCEPDLVWQPDALATLIGDTIACPVACGMVWHNSKDGQRFYDTWAYRKDGEAFSMIKPYHAGINGKRLVELDSAGSCLAIRGDLARAFRLSPADVLVGFCRDVRGAGGSIWLDTTVDIVHP